MRGDLGTGNEPVGRATSGGQWPVRVSRTRAGQRDAGKDRGIDKTISPRMQQLGGGGDDAQSGVESERAEGV